MVFLTLAGCSEVLFDGTLESGALGVFGENPYKNEGIGGNSSCEIVEVMTEDSFERDQVDESGPNNVFGWRKIVNDLGTIVGPTGNKINARTYKEGSEMGLVSHLNRALYFFGRPGNSTHHIYLISEPLPLTEFEDLGIVFDYLLIDLEANLFGGKAGLDNLRLEVCKLSPDECGAGSTFDNNLLKDDSVWDNVFEIAGPIGQGIDGHNQSLSDWKTRVAILDLSQYQRQHLVFRFNIFLDEGFLKYLSDTEPDISTIMEDGVALDKVGVASLECLDLKDKF